MALKKRNSCKQERKQPMLLRVWARNYQFLNLIITVATEVSIRTVNLAMSWLSNQFCHWRIFFDNKFCHQWTTLSQKLYNYRGKIANTRYAVVSMVVDQLAQWILRWLGWVAVASKQKPVFKSCPSLPPTAASAQSSADRLSAQNTDADDDDSADNDCVIDTKKWHQQSCPSLLLQLVHNHQLTKMSATE